MGIPSTHNLELAPTWTPGQAEARSTMGKVSLLRLLVECEGAKPLSALTDPNQLVPLAE